MEAYNRILTDIEKEVERLRRNNLQLRLHMDILLQHPQIRTAEKIRKKYYLRGVLPMSN